MKKQLSFLLSLVIAGGLFLGNNFTSQAATVTNGSYVKDDSENNPIVSQDYGADPGVMVYNDTVYVYATNDTQELSGNNENTYGKINTLNCYSSTDMVNWTDHGSIAVAGKNGAAKWANNSWAPCAAHKKINGKEKFFLYFANNGSGIGVLTADSPTGPWTDPIGKALVTGSTPGCSGVTWMFDPAVLVDSDGTGYLYLGGGIPNNQYEHPKTARVIKLGSDMISVQGSAATIDAPYLFEDSGINKIGNTYYYSYCSNWNCKNGFSNAAIEYMTSSSPMGPFTYAGEIMKNPGVFFSGSTGNNHHCIFEFKGEYYMAYHTRSVESKVIGKSLGYRTTQIDKISVSNGKINSLTPSLKGVNGSGSVNPYEVVQAETMFTQAGITVSGDGRDAYVTSIDNGDFTKVKGVQFSNGLNSLSVKVRTSSNGSIEVRENSPSGTLLGTINVSNTNGSFKDFSGTMKNVSGSKNICFVFKSKLDFDSWTAGNGSSASSGSDEPVSQADLTLLNTYAQEFGYSGTCINLYQLRNSDTLAQLKKNYNSITLENEMKPDALLGGSPKLMSVSEAKENGYYIPDGYADSYVPQINFSTVDEVMKICYENGLHMRAHTLVWHSQTPTWFFRNGYNSNGGFVSPAVMDARMEMYIKTVMNHVCLSQYGGVVYAWDVVNEYLHAQNSGWESVYGKGYTSPAFVKKAFTYAHQTLDYFGLTDSVKLFYNDYNTYMEVNDVIKLVNFINSDGKVCDGVGMQSHLGTGFPSVDYYTTALKSFVNAGFEVQITEMDITNKGDDDLSNYAYNLYKNINAVKKSGGKITSVTWWGLSDQTTWISNAAPLLFYTPSSTKPAYQKVLQAYVDVFGMPTSGYTPSPIPTNPEKDPEPSTGGNTDTHGTAEIENGWYYIKNTLSQKYLTVEGDTADGWVNVCISQGTGVSGQKWYVTNIGDGYITLTSKLGSSMLDVSYGEDEDGTNIGIYQGHGGEAQQFIVKLTDTAGVYTIATKASNGTKVLDVYNHETKDGTNVCQWSFWGNPNQQWQFEKVNGEPDPNAGSGNGGQSQEPSTQPENPTPSEPSEQPSQDQALTCEYSISSWGSGYNVNFKIVNNSGSAVNTWKLVLDKSTVNISSSWNVNVEETSDSYIITPVEWNSQIAAGQNVEFGIIGEGNIGDSIGCTVQ